MNLLSTSEYSKANFFESQLRQKKVFLHLVWFLLEADET